MPQPKLAFLHYWVIQNISPFSIFSQQFATLIAFVTFLLREWSFISSVQFPYSVVSHCFGPHGLQHARLPFPSPISRACSKSLIKSVLPLNRLILCCPPILASIFPSNKVFSSESGLHIRWPSIGASVSAPGFPMNIQDWFPLRLTGLISLQSKGLSRVFSNHTVQKHQFFTVQLSL